MLAIRSRGPRPDRQWCDGRSGADREVCAGPRTRLIGLETRMIGLETTRMIGLETTRMIGLENERMPAR